MEFPHLGQHCSQPTCKQLDFLPMKCDACSRIFCNEHIVYNTHNCPEAYRKDNQIPVCPLCNKPCPVKKGELPDVVVGRHIESDCQSDPAKERRKVYTNKCSKKGCKQKELVPVKCETCRLNFCLRHRHEQDHNCQGFQGSGMGVSSAGAAAILRSQQQAAGKGKSKSSGSGASTSSAATNRNTNNVRSRGSHQSNPAALQGSMSEDEALARALAMSMNGAAGSTPQMDGMTEQEREDFLLAQALSASEQEARATTQRRQQTQSTSRSVERCAVQ